MRSILAILAVVFVLCWFLQASPSFSQTSSIIINEFIPNPVGSDTALKPEGEWVELYNPTDGDLDVGGWVLKDSYDTHILEISPGNTGTSGTTVGSKSHLVVYRDGDSDFSLNQSEDQVRLFDDDSNLVDSVPYSGSIEEGKSWSLIGAEWVHGTAPTPGARNTFPEEETKDEEDEEEQQKEKQQPQPAISFSSPSTVPVGTSFSVSVTLKDFKPGTYFLKVLIGKGDKFYDGRTKGTSGKWLAWNAGWADFPKITIGSGSGAVQAKTDDDVAAGNYLTKVRAYDGKDTFDSDTKPLTVTGSAKPGGSAGTQGSSKSAGDESGGPSFAEATEGGAGEVKGEEAPRGEGSKLNFYIILGIFGMLVGSGGLILSVAKKKVVSEANALDSHSEEERGDDEHQIPQDKS